MLSAPTALKDRRIMVIEGGRIVREIPLRFLGAIGVKEAVDYASAESGWEALVGPKAKAFDLMIVDLILPGVSGQSLIKT
jgi:CheY-like chemotaxis protein